MNKKDRTISNILFQAAEEMERRYFFFDDFCSCCCPEIDRAASLYKCDTPVKVQVFFAAYFKPRGKSFGDVWFGELDERNIERRILALYLAAHAAYSEGL